MIARIWHGWAPAATADDYQRHFSAEVAKELKAVPGFRGARLLRSEPQGDEVQFTVLTFFADQSAIDRFAGDKPDQAVVRPEARRLLLRWDELIEHHVVACDVHLTP
jgi:heme-degrading monooxygenase HmoA